MALIEKIRRQGWIIVGVIGICMLSFLVPYHALIAQLKIGMTAKLCQKLYQDGLVRYVQVSAVKN